MTNFLYGGSYNLIPGRWLGVFDKIEHAVCFKWRVVVDEMRTLQLPEIQLLIQIYRKRSTGWQISLDEPLK